MIAEIHTEVVYQMSHHYVPEAARGVRWDDPALGIDWALRPGARHFGARCGVTIDARARAAAWIHDPARRRGHLATARAALSTVRRPSVIR